MFDIDTLTMSMNYQPVFAGNQTNGNARTKANIDAGQAGKKTVPGPQYDPAKEGDNNDLEKDLRDQDEALRKKFKQESERFFGQGKAVNTNSTNRLNTVSSPVNVVSSSFTTVDPGRERAQRNEFESMFGQDNDANGNKMFTPVSAAGSTYVNLGGSILINVGTLPNADLPTDPLMPDLEDTADLQDTGIFNGAYDDKVEGAVADFNNLELTTVVSPIPTTRIHMDHPKEQIIRDLLSAPQTRRMTKTSQEHVMVYRNKKDERGVVVRNKARLVAKGYTQEQGINYDEVFAPVARIEAIRLFLAYASFMGFIVYQMDVKCAFLYGTIEEEVYVCQAPSFEDPVIYKVEKALYGLHQAHRAWNEHCLPTLKRIFRYLKGQPKLGLWYPKDSPFDLEAFSDSDYAGSSLDRKSTTGEYVAVANCCVQVLWIQNQMLEYGFNFINTKIYIENESTKPTESEGFEQIIDFLNANPIKYALTVNPTVYTLCIEQFWATAKKKNVNDEAHIQALVDKKKVIITIKWIEAFVSMDTELVKDRDKAVEGSEKAEEGSFKRARSNLEQEDAKRQRLEEENESLEIKRCLEIILEDDDDVTIEATPLSSKSPAIVDYKIYKEGKKSYFKISEQMNMVYYLLVEKMYPFTRNFLLHMWNDVRLQVDYEVEMAYDLLRLIMKQINKGYVPE
nr:putative ribonuclease H-like domain-containing protein [Tanacetum cinerariifolium]